MASIHDTMDYGYAPSVSEPGPVSASVRTTASLPQSAVVSSTYLPPVGKQTTPSCFVWSSTYGLATFAAAQAGNYDPTDPSQQASPGYTYVKVLLDRAQPGTCTGGQIVSCFNYLKTNGGTPSMQAAPTPNGCSAVWSEYGTTTIPPDANFSVTEWTQLQVTGPQGLDNVRTMIAQGIPLVYGTRLYTDFPHYTGSPSPYVGNGVIAKNPNGKLVGHCMMIIGYDDGMGALLLQNSFGKDWGAVWSGSGGYVWMAYDTFQTLAQGTAFYIAAGG